MRYFKTQKTINNKQNKVSIILITITLIVIFIINLYIKNLSNSTTFLSKIKIEEITKYYLNQTIKKYVNLNTNDYIKINLVNNNIVSVDIDNYKSNIFLKSFLEDLEQNTKNIEWGNINKYYNLEIITCDNGLIIFVPFGVVFKNAMFASLGPKIPVKISFLENIEAYIDVNVENYGINNSLIKLYLNIKIKELIEMPMDNRIEFIEYKYLISSKVINGKVPSIYYDKINSNSSIVNNDVNAQN